MQSLYLVYEIQRRAIQSVLVLRSDWISVDGPSGGFVVRSICSMEELHLLK